MILNSSKRIIVVDLFFTILILLICNTSAYCQSSVKAEIKKPVLSLVGCWSAAMEIKDGVKKGIVSDYVYEFRRDGTYEFSYIYKPEKKQAEKKTETWFVIETGKWVTIEKGQTLKLEKDTITKQYLISNRNIELYELDNFQPFNQEDSQRISIKKTIAEKTVEYIYFRRFRSWNGKIGPQMPPPPNN